MCSYATKSLKLGLVLSILSTFFGPFARADETPWVNGLIWASSSTNTLSSNENMQVSGSFLGILDFNLPETAGFKQSVRVTAGILAAYTHQFEGDRSADVMDPTFLYMVNLGDYGIFKKTWIGLGGMIPANKDTVATSMVFAFGPSAGYTFDFGKVTWMQRFGYRHNWYTYDTSLAGKMNTPETFSMANIINWKWTKKWGMGLLANFSYSLDYNGVDKSASDIGPFVSWTISSNWSTSVGFATKAGTLAPSGDYNRIDFYDPYRAEAYWDIILSF